MWQPSNMIKNMCTIEEDIMFFFTHSHEAVNQAPSISKPLGAPYTLTQAQQADAPPGAFCFEERMAYLRQYGSHCMSFSVLQPHMKFFDVPGKGFIAYRRLWGAS